MNDIDWGGKAYNAAAMSFTADVSASPTVSPLVCIDVHQGYTGYHMAALLAKGWNDAVKHDPRLLAVADGTRVRFPGPPVVFGTRKVNGEVVHPNGTPLLVPNIPGLFVRLVM
jgi:hypothetical protein